MGGVCSVLGRGLKSFDIRGRLPVFKGGRLAGEGLVWQCRGAMVVRGNFQSEVEAVRPE